MNKKSIEERRYVTSVKGFINPPENRVREQTEETRRYCRYLSRKVAVDIIRLDRRRCERGTLFRHRNNAPTIIQEGLSCEVEEQHQGGTCHVANAPDVHIGTGCPSCGTAIHDT